MGGELAGAAPLATLATCSTIFSRRCLSCWPASSSVAWCSSRAPLVFTKLPGDVAGGFIRQVFPVYYSAFGALSALAALSAWGQVEALVLAAVAAAFLFAWLWLTPRINAARSASPGNDASATRFGRLHRLSVAINAVQMIAVLVVFVRLAG
jgi:hypothetical protein